MPEPTAARRNRQTPVNRQALTDLRLSQGMSISDLSRRSGVAASHISAVELGNSGIRPGTLAELAKALGVGIDRLLLKAS